jgi:hypothetical protein
MDSHIQFLRTKTKHNPSIVFYHLDLQAITQEHPSLNELKALPGNPSVYIEEIQGTFPAIHRIHCIYASHIDGDEWQDTKARLTEYTDYINLGNSKSHSTTPQTTPHPVYRHFSEVDFYYYLDVEITKALESLNATS